MRLAALLHDGPFDGVRIATEATNWFWLPFFELLGRAPELQPWPLELYAFNPRVTARYRDTFLDMDKDDPEDAYVLTDRLRLGRELPHPFVFDAEALALRTLTRLRFRFTQQLVMYSQVEQQIQSNDNLKTLISQGTSSASSMATSYLGKKVSITNGQSSLTGGAAAWTWSFRPRQPRGRASSPRPCRPWRWCSRGGARAGGPGG